MKPILSIELDDSDLYVNRPSLRTLQVPPGSVFLPLLPFHLLTFSLSFLHPFGSDLGSLPARDSRAKSKKGEPCLERRQHTVEQDEGSRSGCRVGFLSPFGVHPLRLRNREKWGWRDAQGLRSLPGLLEGSSLFPGDHTGQLTAACSSRSGTLFWLLRVLGYAPSLLTPPFSPPPPQINK